MHTLLSNYSILHDMVNEPCPIFYFMGRGEGYEGTRHLLLDLDSLETDRKYEMAWKFMIGF
jgi:hypothetical protein